MSNMMTFERPSNGKKTIKHWSRAWKVRLIDRMNPEWDDLYDSLF
jgi:predicted GIY-YIG superfamily endonuclease